MSDLATLKQLIADSYAHYELNITQATGQLTVEVPAQHLHSFCLQLRDDSETAFDQLMDIAGVDYLDYGLAEWEVTQATATGFERGVDKQKLRICDWDKPRFAAVY